MKRLARVNSFLSYALAICMVAVAACAQVGLQADTFNKRTAAAYTTVAAVADSAALAQRAGKLSPKDVDNVIVTLRASITGLQLAESLHATDPSGGEAKLTATLTVLTALQGYLAPQGGKP
jgi:hypothetical protein